MVKELNAEEQMTLLDELLTRSFEPGSVMCTRISCRMKHQNVFEGDIIAAEGKAWHVQDVIPFFGNIMITGTDLEEGTEDNFYYTSFKDVQVIEKRSAMHSLQKVKEVYEVFQ